MLNYTQTLERETLQARYLVLELAATLDRLDEAASREGRNTKTVDPRLQVLLDAIGMIATPTATPNRTPRILERYANPE